MGQSRRSQKGRRANKTAQELTEAEWAINEGGLGGGTVHGRDGPGDPG